MTKINITLSTNVLAGLLLMVFFTHCSQENSDLEAVKKSSSDLGAMCTDKTVEEVVQDVAGINGTVKWTSSIPSGDFPKDIRLVEVEIKKPDTAIYNEIKIQFLYNRSTRYVKQGGIRVDGQDCSIMQWWEYYINILKLNSGVLNSNTNIEETDNKNNKIQDQQDEPIKLTFFTLSSIPDSLYGCSCLFSESKSQYNKEQYLYFNDMGINCLISINNEILYLKCIKEEIYENESYKVIIQNRNILSSAGEGSELTAEIVVLDKNSGLKTTKRIYGICGC